MKNKPEIIVKLIPHTGTLKRISEAWGNGYLLIPVEHPAIIDWEKEKNERKLAEESVEDDWREDWYSLYFSLPGMEQEITFTAYTELNGQKYVEIGFDTCHSHNHAGHDSNYVMAETLKLKAIVDSYKGDN